jgi:hypothetical protein
MLLPRKGFSPHVIWAPKRKMLCLYKFVDAGLKKCSEKKLWAKNLEERRKNRKLEKNRRISDFCDRKWTKKNIVRSKK